MKELEILTGKLLDDCSGSSEKFAEAVENTVEAFEQALAYRAAPPRPDHLHLATKLIDSLNAPASNCRQKLDQRALHHIIARLYQAMVEREKAFEHAQIFCQLTPADATLTVRADANIFLAKACYWNDNQQGAVDYQRTALDLLDQARQHGELSLQDEKSYNTAYTVWAFRYAQNTCDWTKAERTFEFALRRARQWDDPGLLSAALLLYAESKMFQGEWQECETLGAECARAALAASDPPTSDYPFWIWGRALVHIGRVREAQPELERAISIARDIGDAVGLSEALISQAEAMLADGNREKAMQVACEAQQVAAYAGLDVNLAQVRIWRFWIEMEVDSSLAASHLEPIHLSMAEFEKCGMRSGWACSNHALGHALALCGRDQMAHYYLMRAAQDFSELGMPWHRKRVPV